MSWFGRVVGGWFGGWFGSAADESAPPIERECTDSLELDDSPDPDLMLDNAQANSLEQTQTPTGSFWLN
jgi:hypothetical protein